MEFDLLIKNGIVIDGTGGPGKRADLGVKGDRIEVVGALDGAVSRTVMDASGKVVTPGFIDVHVHSELALLGGLDRYAPLKMGVTTQLSGPDGFSWAPLSKQRLREQRAYLHVFYEDDLIAQYEQMSVETLLSLFRGRLPSNLALQAPHGSIRVAAMGWAGRLADEDELTAMKGMVREWMEAGAKAFCTGLDYEPMRRADTRELIALSKVAAQYGGLYVAHQRGYAERVVAGCTETFEIARQAGIPVHISHFPVDPLACGQLEWANSQQLDVSFDMYPYTAGCTHLLLGLPPELQLGSPEEVSARLRDKHVREHYAEAFNNAFPLDRVVFSAVDAEEETGWEGKTLGQVQREMGLSLPDVVCEILLQTHFRALMIYHWPPERYPILEPTFRHPQHMVGTDGIYVGKKPHPRGFGTYPKVLGEYVRERKWLSLEQAVYKMTGFPARRFHLNQRGVIAAGYYADLVVFDPETVGSLASYDQPRQDPEGIEAVFVNGRPVIRNNQIVPGLHGKLI